MRLDFWLPDYHFSERHGIKIDAAPEKVFEALINLDITESRVVKALLAIRRLPQKAPAYSAGTVSSAEGADERWGFIFLEEVSNREIVLGMVGQFWKPSGGSVRGLKAVDFSRFNKNGYCKVAWNLHIDSNETGGVLKLTTETRVQCLGRRARLIFGLYWALIRPFSGIIRLEILKSVKKRVEKSLTNI